MAGMHAADSVRYHIRFVKIACSLPDAIHLLPDMKPEFVKPSFAEGQKKLESFSGMFAANLFRERSQ